MVDVKRKRTEAGLTQQQLADRCHVVRQTISEIERGRIKPSVQTAKLLGEALGVQWSEFFED